MIDIDEYSCLVFDLDGTIIDGEKKHYACYRSIIEYYGGIPISREEYWRLKRNKIKRTVLLEKSCFQGTYEQYSSMWIENIERYEYLKLDILPVDNLSALYRIKKSGKKMKLVTMRHNSENLYRQLNELHLTDFFDEICVVNALSNGHKYDAFEKKAKEKMLFIGDTEEDELSAAMLNSDFCAVTSGLRAKEYLHAKYYVYTIAELCCS